MTATKKGAPALTLQQEFEAMLRGSYTGLPSPVDASDAERDLYQILRESFFGGAVTVLVERRDVSGMAAYCSELEAFVKRLREEASR